MLQYQLVWHKSAQKQLEKLKRDREIILNKLYDDEFLKNPHQYVQRLSGYQWHKMRVNEYRVIIKIIDEKHELHVLFLGHRSSVYKKLPKHYK